MNKYFIKVEVFLPKIALHICINWFIFRKIWGGGGGGGGEDLANSIFDSPLNST